MEDKIKDKLINARAAFGISAAFMSEILGFGANTIRQYENGKEPNKSHWNAITIAITPYGMKSYLDNSPKMIKERKEFPALYFKVQGMCFEIEQELQRAKARMNENYLQVYIPKETKFLKKRAPDPRGENPPKHHSMD